MTKRERTRATVGERIAEEAITRALNINMSNTRESRKAALARRIDAAVKRAVRDTFQSASEMIDRDSEGRIREYLNTKYGVKL